MCLGPAPLILPLGGLWERCEAKPGPGLVAGKGLTLASVVCGLHASALSACRQMYGWRQTGSGLYMPGLKIPTLGQKPWRRLALCGHPAS